MKFKLRTLLCVVAAAALLIGGYSAYTSWRHSWRIEPTEFFFHLADSEEVICDEVLSSGKLQFNLSGVDLPRKCYLSYSNSAYTNHGMFLFGSSSVRLDLDVGPDGRLALELLENEHLPDIPMHECKVGHRIRMKFREDIDSKLGAGILVETIVEGYDNVVKSRTTDTVSFQLEPAE
jgi:hypothetical protein